MQYAAGDYGHDGYAGRHSQIEDDEEPWVPDNYLEKGTRLRSLPDLKQAI